MNVPVARKNKNMVPALMDPELIFSYTKWCYNKHYLLTGLLCGAIRVYKHTTDGKVLQLSPAGTNYTHLTSANTVSEDSDGDGAITTRGSPNNTSSQSI